MALSILRDIYSPDIADREDKTITIPDVDRTAELGDMTAAVQVFKDNMIRAEQIAGAIAAVVEEQSAASGTQEVSSNIGSVRQAASETGIPAEEVLAAAQSLNRETVELKSIVDRFLTDVKVA